jgi:hypothetical protein
MPPNSHTFDTIVLGAGAAGLMCAIEAGKRGRRVAVLERNAAPGEKIRISGGGRCNFTNVRVGPENFLTSNPGFQHSALARYTPDDFIALVERHGIAYHEKTLGQLFCDGSSQQIIDMLLRECAAAEVDVRTGIEVRSVDRREAFAIDAGSETFESETLVVATGGLSISKIGATDFGYRLAKQFGHSVVEPRPGLVPLKFGADDFALTELAGVSTNAVVTADGASFRENILFTHRGLSGPAILQASSYWTPRSPISIDLFPDADPLALLMDPDLARFDVATALARHLPQRLASAWCARRPLAKPLGTISRKEREEVARELRAWSIEPAGTEGFSKAEVTCGGVDTRELSSKTMESKLVRGLFFIGEVVDVTGWLGGYNFQWAWSSGWAAGKVG